MTALRFKVASEAWEFEQVAHLNYATFVEEIPQHPPNADRSLVDRGLARSTCFIALEGTRVVGMVAVGDERPFSIDRKLPDLEALLPPHARPCEFRLLAIDPARRGGRVFAGLARHLWRHCRAEGYDLGIISAAGSQERLYRHLGFVSFGPPIGTPDAPYQGMYVTWDRLAATVERIAVEAAEPPVLLLPGPVEPCPAVRAALTAPPISHRSAAFLALAREVRGRLCALAGASRVQILLGSGTLANDAAAAQLRRLGGRGVVCANGEFGDRLAGHARRAGLEFDFLEEPWGEPLPYDRLAAALDGVARPRWVWAVHGETSTGVRNDLPRLRALADARGARLALDCVSTLGMVPVDLSGVWLATAVSGKGLAAPSGLAMIFHAEPIPPDPRLPAYLDLGQYAASEGVPFTASSLLYGALRASLRRRFTARAPGEAPAVFADRVALDDWVRARLAGVGLEAMAPVDRRLVGILTVRLPGTRSSVEIGEALEARGLLVHYRNGYLIRRNLVQLCFMGEVARERLEPLFEILAECVPRGLVRIAAGS